MEGVPIVISGPSGAGKSELIKYIVEKNNNFIESVGCTTRMPRDSSELQTMKFLNKTEFEDKINKCDFLEYTIYNGNFYGTEITEMEKVKYKNVLFSVSYSAAAEIKKRDTQTLMIYILPPTFKDLLNRLGDRYSKERVDLGMSETLSYVQYYDYLLISENNKISSLYDNFIKLINKEQGYLDFSVNNYRNKEFVSHFYDELDKTLGRE